MSDEPHFAVALPPDAGIDAFRIVASSAMARGLSHRNLTFVAPGELTLLPTLPDEPVPDPGITVTRQFSDLMAAAICHRATDRLHLLYEVLWRLTHGERLLLKRSADPAVAQLNEYAKNVGRDVHKMHAFLRFRPVESEDGRKVYSAWFEPQHYILRRAIPFFTDRFAQMDWFIATPIGTAAWQERTLTYGPPVDKPEGTEDEVLDELWTTYYRTTFNPARVRVKAMTAEMPKHYWKNMPETAVIPDMLKSAGTRLEAMAETAPDTPRPFAHRVAAQRRAAENSAAPAMTTLAELKSDAAACTRCPLFKPATQTVFGEGPEDAPLVFVGEQPGDQEDLAGRPFVGPAGQLFDRALADAGLDRRRAYVTNAVKHFKYVPRGKRRIHNKPNAGEIRACRHWLDLEIEDIEPTLIVAMGATAVHALMGKALPVTSNRGPAQFETRPGFITVHPSYLLRIPEADKKRAEYDRFVEDLVQVRNILRDHGVAA